MMTNEVVFEVFSDAASYNNGRRHNPNDTQYTCSAGILTLNRETITAFDQFNIDSTNNHGEAEALYFTLSRTLSILRRIKEVQPPYNIDLYSDSGYCIQGLRDWLPSWKKRADRDGNWYSTSGKVAQQEVFKRIDRDFLNNPELNLRLYHIRGHINLEKKKDVDKAIKSFKQINGFMVDLDKFFYLIKMNQVCDNYAVIKLAEGLDKIRCYK